MTMIGQRRTRAERVAAHFSHQGPMGRFINDVHQKQGFIKTGLILFSILLITVFLRAWDPPFKFRYYQIPDRDIVSRVQFSVESPQKTDEARQNARYKTPRVYQNDPSKLIQFKAKLANTVQSLLTVDQYAKLSEIDKNLWDRFLPSETASQSSIEEKERLFTIFHSVFEKDPELTNLKSSIDDVFSHYQNGLLLKIDDRRYGSQTEIVVYPVGSAPENGTKIPVSDVLVGNFYQIKDKLNKKFSVDIADLLFQWIRLELKDTLTEDVDATDRAQAIASSSVRPVLSDYAPGQILQKGGQAINIESLQLLKQEHLQFLAQRTWSEQLIRTLSIGSILFILFLFAMILSQKLGIYHLERYRDWINLLSLMVAVVFLSRGIQILFGNEGGNLEIIPILLFAQLASIAWGIGFSIASSFVIALALNFSGPDNLGTLIVFMGTIVAIVVQNQYVHYRSWLIVSAFFGACVCFLLSIVVGLLETQIYTDQLQKLAMFRGVWTFLSGFLISGLLPFVERPLGILSDISLLELGNPSHPLLQKLFRQAPATYNHSLQVASIAEAAAEEIGANGALIRVGAYFHDIGKLLHPDYFTENQINGINIHDTLEPRMSTIVIVSHVKDGIDLAREHHLPEPIIDLIEQHHGTSLCGFFYDKAQRIAREKGDETGQIQEESFRYPGPKPQTKEAGILLLSDVAESACRSLSESSPGKIDNLVRQLSEKRLEDGQFDECDLTLREIRVIENSIVNSIIAIHHSRIRYPERDKSEKNDRNNKGEKSAPEKSALGKTVFRKSSVGKSSVGKSNIGKSNTSKSSVGKSNVGKSSSEKR